MNVKRSLLADRFLVTHSVGAQQSGVRLDAFLKERYRRRSREQLKEAIRKGAITIQRKNSYLPLGRAKPSLQLLEGDEVQVLTHRGPEPEVSFDYRRVYEDEQLLIVDKPGNLPVHPAGKFFFNTLLVHLRTQGFREPLRAEREYFLVHRIDRETSGLIILAKSREMAAALVEQFALRKTKKRYLAIVHGAVSESEFLVNAPLGRLAQSRIRVKMHPLAEAAGGLPSLTRFHKIETRFHGDRACTLLECFPETGRQHQIRAHLALSGFPIVGDKLYSLREEEALPFYESTGRSQFVSENESASPVQDDPSPSDVGFLPDRYISPEVQARLIIPRHALHAAEIEFEHPATGKHVSFSSALPEDLSEFFKRWRHVGY